MDVAPVGGGGAAGEHAVPVAAFDGAAQMRRDDPLVAADVQRQPVGAHHHPGDRGVAGQPAGAGGGDPRPEPGAGRARPGRAGVGEVLDVDGDDDVRLDRAQQRQAPRRERVVGQLHQRVGQLLGPRADVALWAGGLHDRLQRGLQLLPTHGVQLPAQTQRAVGVPGQAQGPALGGVRLGPVGIQRLLEQLHRGGQIIVRPPGGDGGPYLVERR
jgi:hypothetical protein